MPAFRICATRGYVYSSTQVCIHTGRSRPPWTLRLTITCLTTHWILTMHTQGSRFDPQCLKLHRGHFLCGTPTLVASYTQPSQYLVFPQSFLFNFSSSGFSIAGWTSLKVNHTMVLQTIKPTTGSVEHNFYCGGIKPKHMYTFHHHLPPRIRSVDLFQHRHIAIVSWGIHDLFFLEVCSWGRVSAVWCCPFFQDGWSTFVCVWISRLVFQRSLVLFL